MPTSITKPLLESESKPMTTIFERLWYYTSDQYLLAILQGNPKGKDREFLPIDQHHRTTIPLYREMIPDRNYEGSFWVRNHEELHAFFEKAVIDSDFPFRVCYYTKKDNALCRASQGQ